MRVRRRARSLHITLLGTVLAAGLLVPAAPSTTALAAPPRPPDKQPVAIGTGGAVATVDPDATRIGIEVLRRGGNAVDAAVAAAAALGVTEPYSAGIGGGGFFVYYDPHTKKVHTIDGRETAPRRMRPTSFTENGVPIPFDEAVTSGLSVGVPGTPLTWQRAVRFWGRLSLAEALAPAEQLARRGFVVDETFRQQTADNAARFAAFTSTRKLFLPGGQPPAVGTIFRNPDLARTYHQLGRSTNWLYQGELGQEIVRTVQHPPVAPGTTRKVRPGLMTRADLAAYFAPFRLPTQMRYRWYDVVSMRPPSSGGTTVGEALNILERFPLRDLWRNQALHLYLEASALAFADRNRYVGDPKFVDVPVRQLLSDGFARERACLINPRQAATKPVLPGSPDGRYERCRVPDVDAPRRGGHEGGSTTHLTVVDRWGGVVSHTLTIEQTGGSGIVVPGRGFLLNNELTDFNFTPTQGDAPDPNLPGPGKRPRSSMSPTIVFRGGEPFLALGSPGGSMIITTVLEVLINRLDLGMSLPEAIAAPRASQRNTPTVYAEPGFDREWLASRFGHEFTETAEIGAVAAVEVLRDGRLLAAAEPARRGGGSAMVVRPSR